MSLIYFVWHLMSCLNIKDKFLDICDGKLCSNKSGRSYERRPAKFAQLRGISAEGTNTDVYK